MLTTARRSVWRAGTRHLGRGVLSKTLNYYKLNFNDKKNLMTAYNNTLMHSTIRVIDWRVIMPAKLLLNL